MILTIGSRWWINPLFACHAGIIDVDTVDGGICHDKHGAYAILVVQGDETESPTESTLTYRCGTECRGKFRLTAATPKSREPIRLLRSHSVNSRWGPKAGVRYEGMLVHRHPVSSFLNVQVSCQRLGSPSTQQTFDWYQSEKPSRNIGLRHSP